MTHPSAITFRFDWVSPEGARGDELRATWALLTILVDGVPITRVIDDASRSVRDGVFLPLYPLAEWMVAHWWSLLYEVEGPRAAADNYASRHCLAQAREGFAVPELSVVPSGEFLKLSWSASHLLHQRVSFTESGSTHVTRSQFRSSLLDLASATVARLRELGVRATFLEEELGALLGTTDEEEHFCAAAAALGLDPYAVSDEIAEQIRSTAAQLPENIQQEFLPIADPTRLSADTEQLAAALRESKIASTHLDELRRLKKEVATAVPVTGTPWDQGYELARTLRSHLGLNGDRLGSVKKLEVALRLAAGGTLATAIPALSDVSRIEAVVDIDLDGRPGFVLGKRNEQAKVFTLCRSLSEYLTSTLHEPQLVTRARSDRQKRNRAFAAEFLVPADALRKELPTKIVNDEDIDDLAIEFGVSSALVRHQLANHDLARVATT